MDYCSTCRRHLNGALVCPGCGAYAPDIAPAVIGGRTVPGAATAAAPGAVPTPPAPRPAASVPASTGTGTGRAARRRQLVRWKKTQRRALVATAVALVGGGLTLASTDRSGTDRTQAATAPDLRGMGGAQGPAAPYDDPDAPATASPDRTDRSPSADDGRGRAATEAAPAPTTPSDTRTDDGAAASGPAAPSQPRTTSPDPVSRSGARADTGAGSGAGSESASASGSGSGSGSGTVAPPASSPPAAGSGDGNGGIDQGDGSQASPSAPSTPPAAEPDSSRLCLLVICLG
ncbi:hypothetical protein ADK41_31720 [Streptomyces caelestis]|uniref:Uncharacterized protein n=1 Tax=Streptomyces caelestis TaxID=36816 RepID=A0A0M8QGW4_9ACTN|nr:MULTISPECIES: hypothetical protein [Streptomyces]KOT30772.1 hypothetical protein ADK41_31720 [Streptomyces caelestis]KOV29036.1 hypothetical protein ADK58_10610 [Streptomyces sp. XY152]